MQTLASGIVVVVVTVFVTETAAVRSVVAGQCAAPGTGLGEVGVCSGCFSVSKSESVVNVGVEMIAFGRQEEVLFSNREHSAVEDVFNADMIVVPNMQNSWTVTGCKSVWSPMKL